VTQTQALDEANKSSQARVVELESWAREEDRSVYHDLSLCVIPMPVFLKTTKHYKKYFLDAKIQVCLK